MRGATRYFKRAKVPPTATRFSSSSAPVPPPPEGKSSKFMIVVNNEDFRVETAVLNKLTDNTPPGSLRMMTVVGAGDTTLTSLMHPAVGHVTGLDMSPAQLHLVQLKLATAVSDLTTGQAMGFLTRGDNGRNILRNHLAQHMPEETAEFFLSDELDQDIYHGVLRKHNDNPFNLSIRKYFEETHSLFLSQFATMTMAERQQLFQVMEDPQSVVDLAAIMEPAFKNAPWFQALPVEMQEYLVPSGSDGVSIVEIAIKASLNGACNALRDVDRGLLPADELYTDVFLTGTLKTLPPWLTPAGRDILRNKAGLFDTICGKMEDVEFNIEAPFDLLTLSNSYDFVTAEVATESVKGLAGKCLAPNGQIIIRRACGQAQEILTAAGGVCAPGDDLHLLDVCPLFYRNKNTVACASFS